jgi:hypothetical protein
MEKLLIGLAGVVLGSILTVFKDLFNLHINRKERARYLAIRVTFLLERFISDCLEVAKDFGQMMQPDEQGCIQFYTSEASISFDSLDVDWKSLPIDLMYEILNLPSVVDVAINKISIVAEYGSGPPNYEEETEERRLQHIHLGILANKLANRLREKYKLPTKTRDFSESLLELKSEVEKLRNERVNRQSKRNSNS